MGRRIHSGVLNSLEAPVINRLVGRIPEYVEPDHLSALVGAGMAGVSLAACRTSAWFLVPALVGLAINWFGESFDGALARSRRRERPRVGFLIDRCVDTSSFCMIIMGLGLSPYLSFPAALMLLVAYLVNNVYGLMKLVVDGAHVIGVDGVGATEGRVVIGLWALAFQFTHINLSAPTIRGVPVFDVACAFALSLMIAKFMMRVAKDVERQKFLEEGWKDAEQAAPASKSKIVTLGSRGQFERGGRLVEDLARLAEYDVRSPEKSS
jgi:archaetidylinositol phosphate synthase